MGAPLEERPAAPRRRAPRSAGDRLPARPGEPPAHPHPGRGSQLELWLCRHAEVHAAWQGVAYGSFDVPLSHAGEAESDALATRLAALQPQAVISSDLVRAERLGARVAELAGCPLTREPRLREIDRGNWQGRTVAELRADERPALEDFYADPWRFDAHGGESDADVFARAVPVVDELLAQHAGREAKPATATPGAARVVLAAHYNVNRVLAAHLLGLSPARSFSLRLDKGRCHAFVDGPDGWVLTHANTAGPVPEWLLPEQGDPTDPTSRTRRMR